MFCLANSCRHDSKTVTRPANRAGVLHLCATTVIAEWRRGVGQRPQWDSLPWRPPIQDMNDRPPVRRRSQLILESPTFPGYEGLTTTGPRMSIE